MISFVALLEGDIFSPNLWWDHSELSAHRNCCTSLCSLQIRSTGGISGFSFFLFFPSMSYLQDNWKRTRLRYFLTVSLCLALHGAQRRWGERMKRAVGQTWLLWHATAQKTEGQRRLGFKTLRLEEAGLSAFPAPACGILAAPHDFCFCLEKSFLQQEKHPINILYLLFC